MTGQTSTEYEKYYVPEKSRLALCATTGLILSIYGASGIMNDMTFGDPDEATNSWSIFLFGMFFFAATLFSWFRTAIRENIAGLTIFLESGSINKDYLKSLSRLNIKFNLICRDKSKLQDLRFEFFDWVVEEHVKLSKKDIDFDSEICDNTFYHSNKVLVSEGKEYFSKASWKAGIEKTKEPQRLIDSDEFWEEIEHLNVYNYDKKESTGLGNVK
jgi:hypothetical protein